MAISIFYTKEEFFNTFEIKKMNNKSLTILERNTFEHFFISRNSFNAIMENRVERVTREEVTMPGGRVTKWLGVVTTTIF